MKKYALILLAITGLSTGMVLAQINIGNVINSANSLLGNGLSNDKIVKGLKEALNVGTKNSTEKASKTDGFYKNPLIKIPFPKEAKQMESARASLAMAAYIPASG